MPVSKDLDHALTIFTNKKHCFQGTSSFETGLIDHHHLIYSILKSAFE